MTKGETRIASILTAAAIPFTTEQTFTDLRGGRFRFDFYLSDRNILIEYQGQQHYQLVPKFYRNSIEFEQAQGRDMRKISYALAHSIPLYLVPYWDFDKLVSISDVLNPDYLATSRYANLDAFRKRNSPN